ncbi:MAG: DUF2892 domain-containing protein [Anaerolineales bacterium]
MQIFKFLGSEAGRILRGLAGLILIALGIWGVQGAWQWILIIIGLLPLAAGLFDFCLFALLFGLPFTGERLRDKLSES